MRLRRKTRARHLAEEEEDRVIDLRERLAPYGRPEPEIDEQPDQDDTEHPRRARPLRPR